MFNDNYIKVELVGSREMFDGAMAVRRQVFVREQGIPKDKEFDGNDFCGAHVIAYIQKGERKLPIGTMRIRFFGDCVKFERMAVSKNFRKTNVAENIMKYGFKYSALKGFRTVCGMCKKELLPRWQKCGYHEIKDASHAYINGMELIPICRNLEPEPKALSMISDFYLLSAKEGHWYDEAQEVKKLSKMDMVFTKLQQLMKNKKSSRL